VIRSGDDYAIAANVAVDGARVGSVELNDTIEIPVEPGRHTLLVRNGRNSSRTRTFDAADGDMVAFRCGGKRPLPIFSRPSSFPVWHSRSDASRRGSRSERHRTARRRWLRIAEPGGTSSEGAFSGWCSVPAPRTGPASRDRQHCPTRDNVAYGIRARDHASHGQRPSGSRVPAHSDRGCVVGCGTAAAAQVEGAADGRRGNRPRRGRSASHYRDALGPLWLARLLCARDASVCRNERLEPLPARAEVDLAKRARIGRVAVR
jgi:hypothetical protein